MSIATPLSNHVTVYSAIMAQLEAEFNLAQDDDALRDTLEGLTELNDVLAAMAREVERCEEYADAIKRIIDANKERKERFEHKADKLRQSIAWAMQETGLKKVEAPDVTLSLRNNPPSLVTTIEPEQAPTGYRKVSYSFDKQAIKKAIEAFGSLDWAYLNNQPPSVQIRTK